MVTAMKKRKSGRPPKFPEPRRPVTVTLPESTLSRLSTIDPDRARAIVKIAEAAMPTEGQPRLRAELIEIFPGVSMFLVGPSISLRKVEWLRMVEVSPNRFLLVMPSGSSVDSLEVALTDLLDKERDNEWERSVLTRLLELVRPLRREGRISKAELLFANTAKAIATSAGQILAGALIPSLMYGMSDILQLIPT
jgi:hypothetical protein